MSEQPPPKLAWAGVCLLAMKDGVERIRDVPGGIWRRDIGAHWKVAMNGSAETRKFEGCPLDPYSIFVEFNGFPAGIINPAGGVIAAGSLANEDTFIAAIEADLGCSIDEAFSK